MLWGVFQFGFGFVFAVKRLVTNVSGEHCRVFAMAPYLSVVLSYQGYEILGLVSSIWREMRAAN